MKVKNLVFSGAMASILMMSAAVAEDPVKAVAVWGSTDGGVVLNNLMSSLDAKKADQSTIADGLLADKTIDTTGTDYTTTVGEKTITAGNVYAVGDTGYELAGVTGGDPINYSAGAATQGFSIASSKDVQYATVNATLKSSGEYEINYGSGLTYTTGEVSGTDTDVYTLTYTTADGDPVFAKKHNAEAAETLTIADLVDGSEEKAAYEKLKSNYDANKTTLGELASSLQGQYNTMSTTVGEHNSIASALQEYQDASSNYEGTLAQIVDSSYGAKLSQTLGYDVALTDAKTELTEAGFESTDFLGAVTENKEAIAKVRSDAEAAWKKGEKWISQELGYDTTTTDAKTKLAEAGFESTDFLGAVTENKDAIADRTVSFGTTEDGLTFATIADGTNSADVYTKESADAVFAEKQQWVDNTLGIESKNADAVKEAYVGTNYLGLSTTLTDADIALDSAIKNNANAIDDLNKSMRETDAKLRNDIAALDSKVNDLDENLSAGIASSVALSAVEVSNVKKGEMSVGGGYGNYNSKSAMAFGAALGLTDNWSANAGVGFGFGKDTKASFRVGTNYKFKLF